MRTAPEWLKEIPAAGWYGQLLGSWLYNEAYYLSNLWLPKAHKSEATWVTDLFMIRRYGILYARPGSGKTAIIEELSHRFASSGHRVLVIGPASATEQNTKIRGIKLDTIFKYNNGLIAWSTFGRYGKLLTEYKPDVILIDEISRFKINLAIARPLRRITYHLYASIGFTGTVIENDLDEFFNVIATVAPFFSWHRRKLAYSLLKRFIVRVHSKEASVNIVVK